MSGCVADVIVSVIDRYRSNRVPLVSLLSCPLAVYCLFHFKTSHIFRKSSWMMEDSGTIVRQVHVGYFEQRVFTKQFNQKNESLEGQSRAFKRNLEGFHFCRKLWGFFSFKYATAAKLWSVNRCERSSLTSNCPYLLILRGIDTIFMKHIFADKFN